MLARNEFYAASAAYHSFQDEEEGDETLTILDLYSRVVDMLKNQVTPQHK
jgi:hypothetical protein